MAQRAFPVVRTADDLRLLPDDGNRYEIIDGVLYVTGAPVLAHQRAQMQLILLLAPYVERLDYELFAAPTAVRASEITEVQPDVLVYRPMDRLAENTHWLSMPMLALSVEILSPSTGWRDRGVKKRTYLQNGVAEYWTVDLSERRIDSWHEGDAVAMSHDAVLEWQPVASHPPLVIDVPSFFRRVYRDG